MAKVTRNRLALEQLEDRTTPSLTPLPLVGTYDGFAGGLYGGCQNDPPSAYLNFGVSTANSIAPLDANGNVDLVNGKIGILLIGDTFTQQMGKQLIADAKLDPSISNHIVFINAGQAGQYDYRWAYSPKGSAWVGAGNAVASAGLTPAQVQSAFIWFEGHNNPFPDDVTEAQEYQETILRLLHVNYANVHLAYASSQTHTFPSGNGLFAEPVPYEEGFAVQAVESDQIDGINNLNYDSAQGVVVAPQQFWGPYIWADGVDSYNGFNWVKADTNAYGLTAAGNEAVSQALLAFFHSDPTVAPWFNALSNSSSSSLFNLGGFDAQSTHPAPQPQQAQDQSLQPQQTGLAGGAWLADSAVVQEVIAKATDTAFIAGVLNGKSATPSVDGAGDNGIQFVRPVAVVGPDVSQAIAPGGLRVAPAGPELEHSAEAGDKAVSAQVADALSGDSLGVL